MAWDAALYEKSHSFVWKAGADVVSLLDPKPGEWVLDAGSGTGQLTAQIATAGVHVVGIDRSAEMVVQARENYPNLEFEVADITSYSATREFDAVFSNAVLHWVLDPHAAVRSIAKALRPGGRFVAEFGGKGNVQAILDAAGQANPWYFPSVGEYAPVLEAHGFEIRQAFLFDRPSRLEGEHGLRDWVRMFGDTWQVPEDFEERARSRLYRDGAWWADYRRLRVEAVKIR